MDFQVAYRKRLGLEHTFKYWEGGMTYVIDCDPDKIPVWFIRYLYRSRGRVYRVLDERIISGIVGELYSQDIIGGKVEIDCIDVVYAYLDNLTGCLRYQMFMWVEGMVGSVRYKKYTVITWGFTNYWGEIAVPSRKEARRGMVAKMVYLKKKSYRVVGDLSLANRPYGISDAMTPSGEMYRGVYGSVGVMDWEKWLRGDEGEVGAVLVLSMTGGMVNYEML